MAYFEASPTHGPGPLEVIFTDWSAGGPTSWGWSFGDGGSSTDPDPTHLYTAEGSYTVILTATNQYGSHTRTMDDYITVSEPQAPEAHFSASPTSGLAPLSVTFTDQSSNDPTSWDWDFGDGGTSPAQHPGHTYAAGTYAVSLTVSNTFGSDTLTVPDYITVTEAEEKVYLPLVLRHTPQQRLKHETRCPAITPFRYRVSLCAVLPQLVPALRDPPRAYPVHTGEAGVQNLTCGRRHTGSAWTGFPTKIPTQEGRRRE